MTRYFVHVRKDDHPPETIGLELDSLDAARVEASRCLAEEMQDHPNEFWRDGEWFVDVADERGLILFSVYSAASEASSIRGASA